MKKLLEDYVKLYKDFFDLDYCKEIVKELESVDWMTHQFYDSKSNDYKSFENELSVSWQQIPQYQDVNKALWYGIEKYILEDFKHCEEWFDGWNGYSAVRFNRYDLSTQMKLHCDHIYSLFDGERKGVPVLTLLGCLNDEYEGGEFVMWKDTVIEIPAGSLLIFPSNFLYPHEVKPVKSGVRYSFVSWVW